MLKIKDEISLELLISKYGFVKDEDYLSRTIDNCWSNLIEIEIKTRKIYRVIVGLYCRSIDDTYDLDCEYIKDLIGADLIEKVRK